MVATSQKQGQGQLGRSTETATITGKQCTAVPFVHPFLHLALHVQLWSSTIASTL